MPDGTALDLLPGARFSPSETEEERMGPRIRLSFGSARRAASRQPNLARQYGNRLSDLSISTSISPADKVPITLFSLPDTAGMRAISKSCFNLFAVCHGKIARGHDFDSIREYILTGNQIGQIGTRVDMVSPFPATAIPAHAVVMSSTASPPALIAQFSLFSVARFTVVLSESYHGPGIEEAYLADPWDRAAIMQYPAGHRIDLKKVLNLKREENIDRIGPLVRNLEVVINEVVRRTSMRIAIIRGIQNAGIRVGENIPSEAASSIATEATRNAFNTGTSSEVDSAQEALRRELELENFLVEWARTSPWRSEE